MNNYFIEVNPDCLEPNFDINNRNDPDCSSKNLINDLYKLYFKNKTLPNGNIIVLECINQTRDHNKRWYAKIQLYDNKNNHLCTFGVTADYIGASVYWALKAGLSKDEIIDHLLISRTIGGHIVFPTWYATKHELSWQRYPEGISINKAKGGSLCYYDRIDFTLLAIKNWYSIPKQSSELSAVLDKNSIWLEQFCNFSQYIKYFKLESLLNNEGNIFDLTSFNLKTKTYDRLTQDFKSVSIPQNRDSYNQYIEGCNNFINSRTI